MGTAEIPGVGLIKILNCMGVPEQVLDTGVTVISAEMVVLKVLEAEKVAMLPTPVAANPIAVLLFVH